MWSHPSAFLRFSDQVTLVAQASLGDLPPGVDVFTTSVTGVFVVLLTTGWLWSKPSVQKIANVYEDRLRSQQESHEDRLQSQQDSHRAEVLELVKRAEQAERQRDKLLQVYQDKVIPAITEISTDLMRRRLQ